MGMFKYNFVTKVWSRVLLKSDGNKIPYQNEVMLTPTQLAGYPRTWDEISEINLVKYFHDHLPEKVRYFDQLPSDVKILVSNNVPYHIWKIIIQQDIQLIHVVFPSAFIIKGKDGMRDYDKLVNPSSSVLKMIKTAKNNLLSFNNENGETNDR